jgi:hypothetical protein
MSTKKVSMPRPSRDVFATVALEAALRSHIIGIQKAMFFLSEEERRQLAKDVAPFLSMSPGSLPDFTGLFS